MRIYPALLTLALVLPSTLARASDATPAPSSDTVESNCEAMGGEYFEDGDDFYGCELPSGTTVACLDWYGCISWREAAAGSPVRRDHRLTQSFGVTNVYPKSDALRRNRPIARATGNVVAHQ